MQRVWKIMILFVLFGTISLISGSDVSLNNRSSFTRSKRYLVYPPPGKFAPSKVQLILGLGLPMEVDVSMIIGYVMKFNYVLPDNASYLTNPYVRYDRSINHDIIPDENDQHTGHGEGGKGHVMSRWELYNILEVVQGGSSQSGKACLLRAICEAAAIPFNRDHGLSSQLIHLLLAPSSTSEPFRTDFDRVYHAAEIMGRRGTRGCDSLFPECSESLLEYFTEVHK